MANLHRRDFCRVVGLGAAAIGLRPWYSGVATDAYAAVRANEELLCERASRDFYGPHTMADEVVDASAARVAWLARRPAGWTLFVNGEPLGPGMQDQRGRLFAPDGRIATVGRLASAWFVFLDGKQVAGPYADISTFAVGAGGRVAQSARRDKAWFVIADEKEQAISGEEIGSIGLSEDGKRLAYSVRRQGKWHVVVDGVAGPAFDALIPRTLSSFVASNVTVVSGPMLFSPDGARVAYVGVRKGKQIPVVDGVEGVPHLAIHGLIFSPDSRRFAYLGVEDLPKTGLAGRIVADGTAWPWRKPAFVISTGQLSPYGTMTTGTSTLANSGHSEPRFRADGKVVFTAIVRTLDAEATKATAADLVEALYVEGESEPRYRAASLTVKLGPVVAKAGDAVTYYEKRDPAGRPMLRLPNGREHDIAAAFFVTSDDLSHVATLITDGREGNSVVLDGVRGAHYTDILSIPKFDAASITYVARRRVADQDRPYRYYRVVQRW